MGVFHPPIAMGDEVEAEEPPYKLSDALVADFKDAFERIDKEGTGEIPTSELGSVMRMLTSAQTGPASGVHRGGGRGWLRIRRFRRVFGFDDEKDEGGRGGEGSQRGFQNSRQGGQRHNRL